MAEKHTVQCLTHDRILSVSQGQVYLIFPTLHDLGRTSWAGHQ